MVSMVNIKVGRPLACMRGIRATGPDLLCHSLLKQDALPASFAIVAHPFGLARQQCLSLQIDQRYLH